MNLMSDEKNALNNYSFLMLELKITVNVAYWWNSSFLIKKKINFTLHSMLRLNFSFICKLIIT